jgi:hypothetical protein
MNQYGPTGGAQMIISLPALGIMIKINMPEVRKTIYKRTLPHIMLVVVFHRPQLPT